MYMGGLSLPILWFEVGGRQGDAFISALCQFLVFESVEITMEVNSVKVHFSF